MDSGCGTTKFMRKVLRTEGGETVNDIIFLTESLGIREILDTLSCAFRVYESEIKYIL